MRAEIIVVARDPRRAKTRLRPVLGPADRARLASAMLDDVVAAALATRLPVRVVTDARSVATRVRARGARATMAPARGTRAASVRGLRAAARDGADAALVLAADLPFVTATDLRRLVALGRRSDVVIVADRRGSGTNALFLRPPSRIAPRFGPGSLAAHRRAAGRGGRVARLSRVGVDVDTPADLRLLLRGAARAGTHTRGVLATMTVGAAPSRRRGSPSPRAARSRPRRSPPR